MSLGLYFHLPFCAVHCTYCPFAISTDIALQDAYVDALIREVTSCHPERSEGPGRVARQARASRPARPGPSLTLGMTSIDTIYLGGGTPSRTSLHNLARLFAAIRENFDIEETAEISMEANPEDVSEEAVSAWRKLGVNRVSVGVQSFHDDELRVIGRIHDRAQALDAVRTVVASGARANLDLILGLPNQTAESFRDSLDAAVALGAGHLSLYMLDLEERTPLQVQASRGRVSLPEDDLVADLYVEAIERLGRVGLHQYEISNFARTGEESRHNLRYWTRSEYLGFGLGAHSFVGSERFANTRDIRRYIELAPDARDFAEDLGANEVRRETIFLQLRQTSGMCYEDLVALSGEEGIEWIERGLQGGWLRKSDGRVAFTPSGFLQSNDFISQLF
ncbi:MAG: radical SAM family heme chaperone HemW [Thermoanaerobaculia bacterium]